MRFKLICTNCREIKKKRQTKVYRQLMRVGTTSMHTVAYYRVCCACGTEIWDEKLELKNLKTYLKDYKKSKKIMITTKKMAKKGILQRLWHEFT